MPIFIAAAITVLATGLVLRSADGVDPRESFGLFLAWIGAVVLTSWGCIAIWRWALA